MKIAALILLVPTLVFAWQAVRTVVNDIEWGKYHLVQHKYDRVVVSFSAYLVAVAIYLALEVCL